MRYDKVIFFVRETSEYNAESGDYETTKTQEAARLASVQDTQTETMQVVYGGLKQGSLSIQLQYPYEEAFDYIKCGAKKYRVDYERRLRRKHTFVVSEVQNG